MTGPAQTATTPNLTPEGQRLADALVKAGLFNERTIYLPMFIGPLNRAAALLLTAPEGEGAGLREALERIAYGICRACGRTNDPVSECCLSDNDAAFGCDGRRCVWDEDDARAVAHAALTKQPAAQETSAAGVVGERVTLAECPIGLFLADSGALCLKTEYGNNEGRLEAYIVESGEFFWGQAPQTVASQRRQMVRPIPLEAVADAVTLPLNSVFTPPAAPKTPDAATGGSVGDGGLREATKDERYADIALGEMIAVAEATDWPLEYRGMVDRWQAILQPALGHHDGFPSRRVAQPALVGEDETGVREALVKAERALKPFANRVYNDNGDISVSDTFRCGLDEFTAAYFAHRTCVSALAPQPPKAETPAGVGDPYDLQRAFKFLEALIENGRTGAQKTLNPILIGGGAKLALTTFRAALSTAPAARPGDEVERVRHVKRGTEYEVLGEAEAQVSTFDDWIYGGYKRLRDGMRLTVYRDPKSGKLWCRFTDEMRDGRFVPAAAPAADGGRA